MKLTFEEMVEQINAKGFYIHGLAQIENAKTWSICVRKKNDSRFGYGSGKTIQNAVGAAIADLKSKFTEKQWQEFIKAKAETAGKSKKKRVRLRTKK